MRAQHKLRPLQHVAVVVDAGLVQRSRCWATKDRPAVVRLLEGLRAWAWQVRPIEGGILNHWSQIERGWTTVAPRLSGSDASWSFGEAPVLR